MNTNNIYFIVTSTTGAQYKINPDLMSNEEKENLRNSMIEGTVTDIRCTCANCTQMRISVIDRFYPASRSNPHSDSCPKSHKYQQIIREYNPGFTVNEDTGRITATYKLPISKSKVRNSTPCNPDHISNHRSNAVKAPLSLSALIKNINLNTWQLMERKHYYIHYPDLETAISKVLWHIQNVYINEKPLSSYKANKHGFQFFYANFIEYHDGKMILETYYGSDNHKSRLSLNCASTLYTDASEGFEDDHSGMTLTTAKNQYPIIAAGFYNSKYEVIDLAFIMVSNHGLYAESIHEAKAFDTICDYIDGSNLHDNLMFYKPWEHGFPVYYSDSTYLEDGIIEKRNDFDVFPYVVEIFGMNTPEYNKRKSVKKLEAADHLISWEPTTGEPFPSLDFLKDY